MKSKLLLTAALSVLVLLLAVICIVTVNDGVAPENNTQQDIGGYCIPDYVDIQLIDIDGHARRGVKLDTEVKDIVIHYVGNPMSTAQENRDYFNKKTTNVSSHFIIGLEGEVIQCVPLDEKSSASNERNADTISIEVCHEDETGKFNEKTYASLIELTAWLCKAGNLGTDNIIRHYDITGKLCPLYFVENEEEWKEFKSDVAECIKTTTLEKLPE